MCPPRLTSRIATARAPIPEVNAKERERLATAGTADGETSGSPTKDGEGKRGGWFSWVGGSRKDAKISGKEQQAIVTALENVAIVGEPSAAGGVYYDIEEGLAERFSEADPARSWVLSCTYIPLNCDVTTCAPRAAAPRRGPGGRRLDPCRAVRPELYVG